MARVVLAVEQTGVFEKARVNLMPFSARPAMWGVSARITRPRAVTVRFLNEEGVVTRRDFVGLEATSVQHQIDHLQGRMYFDRLSKMKRDMLLRRAKKLRG